MSLGFGPIGGAPLGGEGGGDSSGAITLTGIASAEAFGSTTVVSQHQTVTLTGIASAAAFGTQTVSGGGGGGGTISFIDSASAGGSGFATIDPWPTTANGDLIIACVIWDNTFDDYTIPTGDGWTALEATTGSHMVGGALMYRFADGSEPSDYTFATDTVNGNIVVSVIVLRDAGTPEDSSINEIPFFTTNVTANSVTSGGSGRWLVAGFGTTGDDMVGPGSMTTRESVSFGNDLLLSTESGIGSGSSGDRTATTAGEGSLAIGLMACVPPSGGGGGGSQDIALTGIASAAAFGSHTVSDGSGGGGGISFVDSETNTGSGTVTINPWVSTQSGDLLIATVQWDGDMTSYTVPTGDGWTTIRKSAGNPPYGTAVFYRLATGSEPSSYSFVSDTLSGDMTASVICLRGAAAPEASTLNSGTMTTNLDATSVTTLGADRWIVGVWAVGMAAITVPGSMTERASSGSVSRQHKVATELVTSAGATGNRTATTLVMAEYEAVLVSVPPAGAASQPVTLTGIASAEAFGTQVVSIDKTVTLTGIASAEAFGTQLITTFIEPTGIASAETFGSHTLSATANIALTGIASAEAFGTPLMSIDIALTGIASAEAFGTQLMSIDIALTGIASVDAFGTQTLSASGEVTLTGIASAEAFGSHTVVPGNIDIALTGIPSAEAFGDHAVDNIYSIEAAGIASAEAFGTHTLSATADIALTGIPSAEAFGTQTLNVFIETTGIASAEAFGTPLMSINIALTGIASAEAFGSHTVVPGNADVVLAGIPSAEAFGSHTLSATANIALTGIASAEAFGAQTIGRMVFLTGVASAEAFGTQSVAINMGGENTIVYVDTKTATGNGEATIDPWPTTQEGDLIIASLMWDGDMATYTVPDGWTTIKKSAGNPPVGLAVFYRFATASEPSTYTFSTASMMGDIVVAVTVLRSALAPEASTINTNTGTTDVVATSVTALGTNRWLLAAYGTSMSVLSSPAGMTERANIATIARRLVVATELIPAVGASGNRTATKVVMNDSEAVLVAIPPAAPPGTNISLTGIASAAAFGTQTVENIDKEVFLTGIASTAAFGTQVVSATADIALTGITSAETFGTQTLGVNHDLTGIPSGEAFGTPTISNIIEITGIASAETFGSHTIEPGNADVALAGIASAEAFGVQTVSTTGTIASIGIESAEAFGTPLITISIHLTGIASAEAFGTQSLSSTANVALAGIASAEAFGTQVVSSTRAVTLTGIASAEAFGTQTVAAGGGGGGAISYVDSASAGGSGFATIDPWVTTQTGDLIIATVTWDGDLDSYTVPTGDGWTTLKKSPGNPPLGIAMFYRTATASEPLDYTFFTNAVNGNITVSVIVLRNAGTPEDSSINEPGIITSNIVANSVTSGGSGRWLVAGFASYVDDNMTGPGSMTTRESVTFGLDQILATESGIGSGASGTRTATTAGEGSLVAAVMAVIPPAGEGGSDAAITLTGIASAEAFGTQTVAATANITLAGIASAETFGTQIVTAGAGSITLTGIASAEAFGTQTVVRDLPIALTGITSAEAFGTQSLSNDGAATLTGIASAEAFGSTAVSRTIEASASLSSESSVTGTGIILKNGSVLVEGSTTVISAGNVVQGSSASVPCVTTIIAAGSKIHSTAVVNAQAISTVTASAVVITAPVTGSATLGSSSSISASGVIIHYQTGSVLIGGQTTVIVDAGVSSVGNVYNPGNLGGLFEFFAPLVGAATPQEQTFIYNTKNGGTIVVKCPAATSNPHPCVPGSPVSEEQAHYEEVAKNSERLQTFARQNNIDYFENQCWVP